MYHRQRRGRLGTAFQPTVQPQTIPASVGGINALTSLVGMPPEDCIYVYNTVPSEYGLRLRKGYREWATGVNGDVHTLVPFDAQSGDEGSDKLFAVTENGIYDVTAFNTTAPVQVVSFTNTADGAGYATWANFTTDAPDNLVLVADERNGLWYYNGDTDTWFQPNITFPPGDLTTVNDIAFVMTHKQRIWLVKRDSADAYYLPIDAIQGEAVKFNFGSKFEHGGSLRGLWDWTIDGGDGVDDFLICLSGGGDVLVYNGSDPSLPDWRLHGSWFIGQPPQARRIAVDNGGDLYILSSYGVVSLRDLLNGVDYSDVKVGPAGKVARVLRGEIQEKPESWQWALHTHPRESFLQIITPLRNIAAGDNKHRQYVMNLLTQGWGYWRDVPMICSANLGGEYYIGGPDGIVYIYDGSLDNTVLDGTLGDPIRFGGLTSFQPYGTHAQYLKPGYIRTIGITEGIVALNVKAVFDYQLDPLILDPPPAPRQSGAIWDSGQWDVDYWDFVPTGASVPLGAAGWGRTMAIGFRGSSERRITLTAWDVMFQAGGLL